VILWPKLVNVVQLLLKAKLMTFKDNTTLQISTYQFDTIFIDMVGKSSRHGRCQSGHFTELLGGGIVLEMVLIPEGAGQIGSPLTEDGHADDEELHSVKLAEFFMGKYPITQAQWKAVTLLPKISRSLNPEPSYFQGLNRPVEQVSWYDAIEFCARLSQVTGRLYRLPTEAEWEYTCRARTSTPFHLGETLSTEWANYCGEDHYIKKRNGQGIWYRGSYGNGSIGIDRKETTEVDHFQAANAFGLYDMHGNIWEWCVHHSHEDRSDSQLNRQCLTEEDQQPLRGGSWRSSPSACRSASRWQTSPGCCEPFIGFRIVSNITQPLNQPMTPTDLSRNSEQRQTILFLAASPTDQSRLRQDKEFREVKSGLERAKYREKFKLEQMWAVRSTDLRRALLDIEPQLLHFSGHGGGDVGLVLEDQFGSTKLVSKDALANLFQPFAQRGLKCIVLNACYSDVQATAIVQYIPYVIGMNDTISDTAAIEFSIGFYDALGAGWSYEEAFEIGKSAIALEGISEEMIPILRKKSNG
jgi:formylglycine-generating enzyme required for sulfatase activity